MSHEQTFTPEAPTRSSEPAAPELDAFDADRIPLADQAEAAVDEVISARGGARLPRETASVLSLYMREIGAVKLLTPEQEIDLAARIKAGDKEARELMIKANLRLVVKVARRYEGIGMPLLDLISEGNIGLMTAVERFDPAKGAKLSTYACWWIKQCIKRALAEQSKTIRVPVHMVGKIFNMHRTARRLLETLGRDPTDDELADELGITAYQVAQMRVAGSRPASLDAPAGEDGSHSLSDLIEDEAAETPSEKFQSSARTGMLHQMVEKLQPREARILRARFGMDGSSPQTLDEIGQALGVTRERARQLLVNALKKIRKMMYRLEGCQN